MVKKILGVLLLLVLVALGLAAIKPDRFEVQRKLHIQAPAERIYPLLADFHRWPRWSPWEKLDPTMQRSFSGPASGPGAGYAWQGNRDVGRGRMTVASATPPTELTIDLEFIEPFASRNTSAFTLQPAAGGGTEVVWTMRGPMPFVSKLMDLFVGMDRLIGKDFEAGLANLKAAAETP